MPFLKTLLNRVKQESVYFVIFPKQGPKMEGVVLNRVGILGLFCLKQGRGFTLSAAHLHPKMGQVPPRGPTPPPFPLCVQQKYYSLSTSYLSILGKQVFRHSTKISYILFQLFNTILKNKKRNQNVLIRPSEHNYSFIQIQLLLNWLLSCQRTRKKVNTMHLFGSQTTMLKIT